MSDTPTKFTPEQIRIMQDYFASHDFTAEQCPVNKSKFTEDQGKTYRRARELFEKEWKKRLTDHGVKDSMRNFSRDYPLNVIRDFDSDHLAVSATAIHSDPESFSDILDIFFEMTEKPLEAGLNALAKSLKKSTDDLTEAELYTVVEAVADLFFEEMVNTLMHAQNVEGVFRASHEQGAHEDFSHTVDNHDKIDFLHQWTHDRTKTGAMLSLDRLAKENPHDYERALAVEDPSQSLDILTDEEIFNGFLKTLSDEEVSLFLELAQQKTQSDIAEMLGLTQGAVSKRVAKLKEKYKEYTRHHRFSRNQPRHWISRRHFRHCIQRLYVGQQ